MTADGLACHQGAPPRAWFKDAGLTGHRALRLLQVAPQICAVYLLQMPCNVAERLHCAWSIPLCDFSFGVYMFWSMLLDQIPCSHSRMHASQQVFATDVQLRDMAHRLSRGRLQRTASIQRWPAVHRVDPRGRRLQTGLAKQPLRQQAGQSCSDTF